MEQDPQQQRPRPSTVGSRLREAREAAGLTRGDIASRTKIAERHVLAIEEDRFGDLAARTYAVGFARAYARTVALDEAEIAAAVRRQMDAERRVQPAERAPSFEPGDPARVPPRRLAWLAAAVAAAVIVLLGLFWGSFLSPAGRLPDLLADAEPAPAASASSPAAASSAPAPASGPVVLTALDDGVWVSIRDAQGARLLERQLTLGESWTVPADASGPQLRTGRPDALQVNVGGRALPPLAERPMTISGVSLTARDLLARANPAADPAAGPADPAAQIEASSPARRPAVMRPPARRAGESMPAEEAGDAPAPPAAVVPTGEAAPAATSRPAPSVPASTRPEPSVSTETG